MHVDHSASSQHSTSTALLKISNNITTTTDALQLFVLCLAMPARSVGRVRYCGPDNSSCSALLCPLDLSAAFDTVDHNHSACQTGSTYGFKNSRISLKRTQCKLLSYFNNNYVYFHSLPMQLPQHLKDAYPMISN